MLVLDQIQLSATVRSLSNNEIVFVTKESYLIVDCRCNRRVDKNFVYSAQNFPKPFSESATKPIKPIMLANLNVINGSTQSTSLVRDEES